MIHRGIQQDLNNLAPAPMPGTDAMGGAPMGGPETAGAAPEAPGGSLGL